MKNVREAIEQDRFTEFREEFYKKYYKSEPPKINKD